jgi:tripartite-type tricarboxylate transporter receptor subunit TctC
MVSVSARCQDWPSRNIRLIVPFPPGGSTDVGARLIGNFLAQALHTQVVVENRSGADGNIGMEVVAKSAADGYTVLVTTDAVASNVHVFRINFDPLKAFTPVIQVSRQPVVLAVHPSLGVGTLDEFLALARREPGLRVGSSGLGSQQQFVAEWFAKLAGISLVHVPYRGGAPAIQDLIAGRIDYLCIDSTIAIAQIEAHAVKPIAILTRTRSPSLPALATAQEQGLADFEASNWCALFLPKGTPERIVQRLHDAAVATLDTAAVQAALQRIGSTVVAPERRSPEYLQKFVEGEIARWAAPIRASWVSLN